MSKLTLIYDVETSGMKLEGVRASDPRQPHIVSAAVLVLDEEFNEVTASSFVCRQDGWETEPGALAIHGITKERSLEVGIPEKEVAEILHSHIQQADICAAFNDSFDSFIVRAALRRYGILTGESEEPGSSVPWAIDGKRFCVMRPCIDLCKLPFPSGRRGWKFPKLHEAARILLGIEVQQGNHDALDDVRTTGLLYEYLCRRGLGPKPKEVVA